MSEHVAGLDAGFLLTETSTTLWHICGVLVVDPATAPEPFSVEAVRRLVTARLDHIEAFHKMLDGGPLGLLPRWTNAEVDVTAHVVPAQLDGSDGIVELAALAARISATPLDRTRPLWELHVVENLGDGRAAVVAKVHHALADGISAVGLLAGLLDLEPRPPGAAALDLAPDDVRHPPSLAELPRLALTAGRAATRAAVRSARLIVRSGKRYSFAFGGPKTPGHAALTTRRDVGVVSLPIDDIRSVRARFGVTFHDVVLATVAGALRTWLSEAYQLPDRALVAVVPTSTRGADTAARSRNQVSALFVSLPVQIAEPAARLRAVNDDTTRSKELHDEAGPETLGSLAAVAPWRTVSALWRAGWWLGAARALPPVANLLVTSVPGPSVPLYLAGARLVGLYPLGPILEGVPINVTAVSREDGVDVGILTCPDLVPAAPALAVLLASALDDLVATEP